MSEEKATYWRCLNDECGFFKTRRKKYPYNQKGKKWEYKARWLIAKGVVDSPSWVSFRCPHCDYHIEPGLEVFVPLDTKQESIVESFKDLKKKNVSE